MNSFQPLIDLANRGLQPRDRLIWIGIGFLPPKLNALELDPINLPAAKHFQAVAGLDTVVTYKLEDITYGVFRRICGLLYEAQPRRLMVVAIDTKKSNLLRVAA